MQALKQRTRDVLEPGRSLGHSDSTADMSASPSPGGTARITGGRRTANASPSEHSVHDVVTEAVQQTNASPLLNVRYVYGFGTALTDGRT